jgi:hypothetical protein
LLVVALVLGVVVSTLALGEVLEPIAADHLSEAHTHWMSDPSVWLTKLEASVRRI